MEEILSILVSFRIPRNKTVWRFDKRGLFTVRSAYKVAQAWLYDNLDVDNRRIREGEAFGQLWVTLWNVNIPPKVCTGA